MNRIINVANRLPVTVGEQITKSSGGLVSALEGAAKDRFAIQWVGWPGGSYEDSARRAAIEKKLVEEFDFLPVFLDADEIAGYYLGFSNASLWPLLHYMTNYMRYDDGQWDHYRRVNERFADKVLDVAEENDLVWVHDYHLMLVPAMLRKRRPDLRIGFFFHTPFPSSEIFRCHPRRSELLRGVLGADLIGFHTFGYLRHFRSTVLRVLGLESEMGRINDGTHEAWLGVHPIGINSQKFLGEMESTAFEEKRQYFRENWKGKRIVLNVERLDYTKGILHRLQAVDLFLKRYDHVNDVQFIFVAVPSREQVREYQELRENIEHMVGKINGEHATVEHSPIHFIHKGVEFTELCALYSMADVCVVTPLQDGMNLVAKEYVACQSKDPGVLVLSEFAGAAQELVNALIVNPYDLRLVADRLQEALNLDLKSRRRRMKYMRERVLRFDADYWATTYLDMLSAIEKPGFQTIELEKAEEDIADDFASAERVALFLDYDGTLREFEPLPHQAIPNQEVREVLDRLEGQDGIDVFVLSGRSPMDLEAWLGMYDFTLIAEHGSAYRRPDESTWQLLDPNADMSWKARVIEVLKHYEGSTPGSFVEEKSSAVVWHYRQSDPEFGSWKAHQLMSEIYDMVANLPVEIHHGKKIVEVSSIHVNKGAALDKFLHEHNYDFVLCAGDDQTDEGMFRLDRPCLLKVKVGEGDTHADYRISSPQHFRQLVLRLLNARERVAIGGA